MQTAQPQATTGRRGRRSLLAALTAIALLLTVITTASPARADDIYGSLDLGGITLNMPAGSDWSNQVLYGTTAPNAVSVNNYEYTCQQNPDACMQNLRDGIYGLNDQLSQTQGTCAVGTTNTNPRSLLAEDAPVTVTMIRGAGASVIAVSFLYAFSSNADYNYKAAGVATSAFIGVAADKILDKINEAGYLNPIEAAMVKMWTNWAGVALAAAVSRIQGLCPSVSDTMAGFQALPFYNDPELGIVQGG